MWIHRTIIVPAAIVEAARNLGECLHPAAAGMFTTPLSPTGELPATHYVSSGLIEDVWTVVLSDAALLYGAASQGAAEQGLTLAATPEDAQALTSQVDLSDESAEVAFERLGLTLCHEPGEPVP